MDKYIKLLLETESTVILPGLGAIVIDDKEKGTLIFNEYLKFNDGKLDNMIVNESNMDLQEAQNYIAKYIREIELTLNKGETYSIFGLGNFIKTSEGNIEFEGSISGDIEAPVGDIEGPSPTPDTQNENKTVKATSTDKSQKQAEDAPSNKEEDLSSDATIEPVGIKDNIYIEKAEVEHKNAEKEKKPTSKSKKEKPAKKAKAKKVKDGSEKRKKGSVFTWIALVLLLIVSGLAVYIGVNYDQVKEMMGWDRFENIQEIVTTDEMEAEDLTEELSEDISMETEQSIEQGDLGEEEQIIEDIDLKETIINEIADEVKVEQPKEQPVKKENPTPTTSSSGNVHLIAGAFSEQANAESLVKDLVSKGHRAQIVEFKNGKHYVSVASFNSVSEAQAHIPNIENDAPGAWIYRK